MQPSLAERSLLWWGPFDESLTPHLVQLVQSYREVVLISPDTPALQQGVRHLQEAHGVTPSHYHPPELYSVDAFFTGLVEDHGLFDDFLYALQWEAPGESLLGLPPDSLSLAFEEFQVTLRLLQNLLPRFVASHAGVIAQILPASSDQETGLPLLGHTWLQTLTRVLASERAEGTVCLCSFVLPSAQETPNALETFLRHALHHPTRCHGEQLDIHTCSTLHGKEEPQDTVVMQPPQIAMHGAQTLPLETASSTEEKVQLLAARIARYADEVAFGLALISHDFNTLGFLRRSQLRNRFRRTSGLKIDDWSAQFRRMGTSWRHLAHLRNKEQVPLYTRDLLRAEQEPSQMLSSLVQYLQQTPQEVPSRQTQRFQQVSQRRAAMQERIEGLLKHIETVRDITL